MAYPFGRLLNVALASAVVATLTSSCAAYRMGNPFLPAARILVTANPTMLNSKVTYSTTTKAFSYANDKASFTLSPYPGDITPGVRFTDYKLTFYDQQGTEISGLLIPSRLMQINVYLTKGAATAGGGGGSGQVDVPVLNEAIGQYGAANGFRNIGTEVSPNIVKSTDPWSQNLSGKVTFYGVDDNMYPVQAEGTFTVNFETDIQGS